MPERQRIGKRVVDALQPGETVWDVEVKGFGARRQKDATSFVLKTRTRTRRQLWFTIGKHGSPWTAETARAEAKRLLQIIAEGRDPAAERDATRQAPTVAELADRFLADTETRRKPRTSADYRRLVERHVRPAFGKLKLAEVTRGRVAEWHNARRSTPVEANRALSVLRRMLNLARKWGLLSGENPAELVEMYRERPRDRVASAEELSAIGAAICDLPVPLAVRRAVMLLATTGARSGEIRTLLWRDVDLAARTAVVRGTKNGEDRELALNAIAAAFLDPPERAGFVCPALSDPKRPLSEATLHHWWRKILAMAQVDNLRPHDLRHGLATQAARDGASALLLRDLLGHKTIAMANRYVSRVGDEAAAAQRKAGSAIGAALMPEASATAQVVRLTERTPSRTRRKA